MNWKHYLGMAVTTIIVVAIANRISVLSKIMNNGGDLSGNPVGAAG